MIRLLCLNCCFLWTHFLCPKLLVSCLCLCLCVSYLYDGLQCYVPLGQKIPFERNILLYHLRFRELRENCCTMSKRYESNVKIVDYRKDKPICCDESSDPEGPFCFFYATFFKKVLLHLPLSIFEKELLTELNVTPARLHPNSWAFIRAFIILCAQFDISSSVEVTYCGCP